MTSELSLKTIPLDLCLSAANVRAELVAGRSRMEEEEATGTGREAAGMPRDADFVVRVMVGAANIDILLRPGASLAPMAAVQLARYLQEATTVAWCNKGSKADWLKQDEAARLVRQGMVEQEVARTFAVSFSTVRRWVELSQERRRKRLEGIPDFERHGKATLKDDK